MREKYKELFQNTGVFAISNFSSKILIFLLVPIYTRTLSVTDYGFYDLTYTTIQLLFPVLTLGITEAVMIFLLRTENIKKQIFSISMIHLGIGTLVFFFCLIINSVLKISLLIEKYEIFILIFFFLYCFENILFQFVKGINQVKNMAIASISGTLAMTIFNILFLLVFKWGLRGYYIANILGYFIPCMYLVVKLRLWRFFDFKIDVNLQKKMIYYAVPLIINTIGWWVNNSSNRYVVTAICGIGANGLISVAYKIPNIISTIAGIFLQAWQISAIRERMSEDRKSFYSDFFLHYNAILCIISMFFIIGNKFIAQFIFGNDFYEAWKYVPFLVISAMLNSVAGYMGAILAADMNSKALAKSAIYGIIINIIFSIVLTFFMGPQGIAIASMIASFVIYFVREKASQGEVRNKHYNKVLQSWIPMIVLGIDMIYFADPIIAGAIVIFVLYLYKPSIMVIINKLK